MVTIDSPSVPANNPADASITDLVKEAVGQAQALFKTELALAKDELRRELADARRGAIELGVSAALLLIGLSVVLVSVALWTPYAAPVALAIGLFLLLVAAVLGGLGYASLPKKPLDETRKRLETDVQVLKERIA